MTGVAGVANARPTDFAIRAFGFARIGIRNGKRLKLFGGKTPQ
jgi:hypothetical protein